MACCEQFFEWKYYNKFYRIIGLVSLGLCIIYFILTFCIAKYRYNEDLFTVYLFFYVYLAARCTISLRNIIFPDMIGCWDLFNLIILVAFNIGLLIIFLALLFIPDKDEFKGLYVFLILSLLNLIIDIMYIIPACREKPLEKENDKKKDDAFEIYFEKIEVETRFKILNEINKFDIENYFINEENKRLKGLELEEENVKVTPQKIKDKKIDAILFYAKNKYNKSFSPNHLFQLFLDEIKEKCGLDIDKNKFREMSLTYIKNNLIKYLTCPLTKNIFIDPVTTLDGHTFERDEILKEINSKGQNPLTGMKLTTNEIKENKLVAKISNVFRTNKDFKFDTLIEIRKLLINPNTNAFYLNPYVIWAGSRTGETGEEESDSIKYENKVIVNIIEQNLDLLSNEFLEDIK